ncbi:MAG: hypothetical protein D6739_11295 [Nitrospirae bacterium]|nr:MAG: hypothetical protein D6739_11295 [Nitrospirota bacterium]
MARPTVTYHRREDRIPFLRGLLTRSLMDVGLPFQDAYAIASAMRDRLEGVEEIAAEELRRQVAALLEERHGREVRDRYLGRARAESPLRVIMDGQPIPFTPAVLARSLAACAIDPPTAYQIARRIQEELERAGEWRVNSLDLRRKTYEVIKQVCGPKVADDYLVWRRFHRSGRPLILLVGGATGSGKSTVAAEVAYRLGLVRSQSTDMLREVMRLMLSPELLPTLYRSTYNAWEVLPGERSRDRVIEGFYAQLQTVRVAIHATLRRAVTEMVHMVIDGVHCLAPALDLAPFQKEAVVVPVMLAVLEKAELKEHFTRRTDAAPQRQRDRYLAHFDEIWQIQSHLLEVSDQAGVPIVPSHEVGETVQGVIDLVTKELAQRHPPDPDRL